MSPCSSGAPPTSRCRRLRRLRRCRAPVRAPCPCTACTPGHMAASTRRTRQPAITGRGASCCQLECAETAVQSHERRQSTHMLHTSCCWRCGLSLRAMTEVPVQVSLPGWHQQLVRHLPVQVHNQEHPRALQQRRPLFRQRVFAFKAGLRNLRERVGSEITDWLTDLLAD